MKIENGLITEFNIPGIKFAQDLIPVTNKLARSQLPMIPRYITLHNPASGKATAENLTEYADNYNGYKSWHLTIIGNKVFQELPFIEVGYHAGDGYNGPGNRSSIGIEIGEDSISENTAKVFVSYLMKEYNIPIQNVVPHKHWSGKNCPAYTLQHWDTYIENIKKEMNILLKSEAKLIVQAKAGLDNNTMAYLENYKYGETLLIKLAKAMK